MASRKKAPEPAPTRKAPPRRNKEEQDERMSPEALMEWANKELGNRAELCRASDLDLVYITKRLPTGLLTLDLVLKGGFPAAGLSQIVGPKNAGKSYIYWQVIRQLQYLLGDKMRVLLAMTEMRADRTQGRASGVRVALSPADIASMERARAQNGWPPFTAEEQEELRTEVGEIYEVHGMSAEDLYDVVLKAVEENVFHLIVIDSFGNVMSGAEAEAESMRDKTYGGAAGVNTMFIHKLTSMLTMRDQNGRTRDTCIIGINQIRDDIKNPNKEYKSSGGRALEHAKFVDLFISSGKALGKEVPVMLSGGGTGQRFEMWGKEVNWRIEKGKAGIHEGERGNYRYEFARNGANFYMDTAIAGVDMGIIEQAGAWFTVKDENGEEVMRIQGRENVATALEQDAIEKAQRGDANSVMNIIRRRCFQKAGINIDYNWAR